MTRELFIYRRVQPEAQVLALAAAATMQEQLRQQHPGMTARLLRRSDATATPTVMEVYRNAAVGITPAVEQLIATAARCLDGYIAPANGQPGTRHVEVFELVNPTRSG